MTKTGLRIAGGIAFAVFIALQSTSALADDSDLQGLHSFKIVIEDVTPNDCGLTQSDLQTSLSFVLSQSRIKINPSVFGFIYVNVNIFTDCSAASIVLEVDQPVHISPTGKFTTATIWDTGSLLEGSDDMRKRVTDRVETLAKKLVVAWSTANP
jgi:hypothetical protein